jgi:DNA polymerase-4
MWPLPVRDLFMVGPATQKKLNLMGIYTIGDLAKADEKLIHRRLGKAGLTVWHFANGRCADAVKPVQEANKGYGNSITTAEDVTTSEAAYKVLMGLCETVAMRLRQDSVCGSCVAVHLRTKEFHSFSHQSRLQGATNITQEIFQKVCHIFDEAWDGVTPLRQLGVQVTQLTKEPYQQFDLFSDLTPKRYDRKLRLDETVDALRDRFGEDIIRRGKFAACPEGHMAGGLHKERRTGVTKPIPKEIPGRNMGEDAL